LKHCLNQYQFNAGLFQTVLCAHDFGTEQPYAPTSFLDLVSAGELKHDSTIAKFEGNEAGLGMWVEKEWMEKV